MCKEVHNCILASVENQLKNAFLRGLSKPLNNQFSININPDMHWGCVLSLGNYLEGLLLLLGVGTPPPLPGPSRMSVIHCLHKHSGSGQTWCLFVRLLMGSRKHMVQVVSPWGGKVSAEDQGADGTRRTHGPAPDLWLCLGSQGLVKAFTGDMWSLYFFFFFNF